MAINRSWFWKGQEGYVGENSHNLTKKPMPGICIVQPKKYEWVNVDWHFSHIISPPKKCGTHVTPISIFFWLSIPNSIIARHDDLTIIGTWSSMLAGAGAPGNGVLTGVPYTWSHGSSINGRTCIWIYMASWGYNRTYNYKAYNPLCNWWLWGPLCWNQQMQFMGHGSISVPRHPWKYLRRLA